MNMAYLLVIKFILYILMNVILSLYFLVKLRNMKENIKHQANFFEKISHKEIKGYHSQMLV